MDGIRSWSSCLVSNPKICHVVVCDIPSFFLTFLYIYSPGRFFAANELKAMLAHVVLNYDIKFEDEGVIPNPFWAASAFIPNMSAKVLFRKRQN